MAPFDFARLRRATLRTNGNATPPKAQDEREGNTTPFV